MEPNPEVNKSYFDKAWVKLFSNCVLPAAISIFIGVVIPMYNHSQDAKSKVVDNFVGQAQNFEVAAYHFVYPVLHGSDRADEQARMALLDNITNQSHALEAVRPYLPKQESGLAASYQGDLSHIRSIIGSSNMNNLDSFLTQAEVLFTEREKIIRALKSQSS